MHLSTINNTENKLLMYPFHSTPHRYPSAPPTIIRKPCVPEERYKIQGFILGCLSWERNPSNGVPPNELNLRETFTPTC